MTIHSHREQNVQEEQYGFPYHYVPEYAEGVFSQTQHWSWGFRYLGGIQLVLEQLSRDEFSSLIDVGCGDGRFLREVALAYPNVRTLGVDYSAQAVRLASAFNPNLRFLQMNIAHERVDQSFDCATLVEVLEHVPPDEVEAFVAGVAATLKRSGRLVATVPHVNKPVSDKHFQHFSQRTLSEVLEPHFSDMVFFPFDNLNAFLMRIAVRMMGGSGENIIVTNRRLSAKFYELYLSRYLYVDDEAKCGRIAVVCRKK